MKYCFILVAALILLNGLQFTYAGQEEGLGELFESGGEGNYNETEIELIEHFRLFPVNLADASAGELSELPGISRFNAKKIIEFIDKYGRPDIRAMCDSLALSPGQEIILDNCTIYEIIEREPPRITYRNRYKAETEEKRGFREGQYLGSELDMFQRFTGEYRGFGFGIIADKDAGELDLTDRLGGYLEYSDENLNFIAGDYYIEFGSGSLFWKNFGARKGADVINPVGDLGRGIRPYRSTIDYNFLRGGAASARIQLSEKISITPTAFYSQLPRSGSIDDSGAISSIYTAGYYRTENEIAKKNAANEQLAGIMISSQFNRFDFGLIGANLQYDKEIFSNSSRVINSRNTNMAGAYLAFSSENTFAQAELDYISSGYGAFTISGVRKFSNSAVAFQYRNFSHGYRAPFGGSFGEFSNPANEEGFYAAIYHKLNPQINLSLFADFYRTAQRTYTIPTRVPGVDLFTEIIYKFDKAVNFSLRLRSERKRDAFESDNNTGKVLAYSSRNSIRFDINYRTKHFRLRNRLEALSFEPDEFAPAESGILAYSEIKYTPSEKAGIYARASYYSTDSYNSAIWQFEYAMPGLMTTPALYGKGSRYLIGANAKFLGYFGIHARYAVSIKNNSESMSSGYEEVSGNRDGILIIQLDFFVK
jgi:hypothetical protein